MRKFGFKTIIITVVVLFCGMYCFNFLSSKIDGKIVENIEQQYYSYLENEFNFSLSNTDCTIFSLASIGKDYYAILLRLPKNVSVTDICNAICLPYYGNSKSVYCFDYQITDFYGNKRNSNYIKEENGCKYFIYKESEYFYILIEKQHLKDGAMFWKIFQGYQNKYMKISKVKFYLCLH